MDELTEQGLSARLQKNIEQGLKKGSFSIKLMRMLMGPAVIASIAYVDPGNVATNLESGSRYGYTLLWVVMAANVMAMLFQALSARIGIVTGRNLAELSRDIFPRPAVLSMWIVSEFAIIATDLAEFIGGGIGISLLLHISLLAGVGVIALLTCLILYFDQRGFRPMEWIISTLLGIITLCYIIELYISDPNWSAAAYHSFFPHLPDSYALYLSIGIIGATIMPHAIFLHSGLTQKRVLLKNEKDKKRLVFYSNVETVVALTMAGFVNMAMLMLAARVFHGVNDHITEIDTAYYALISLLGGGAALVFLVSLITSGVSSSVVGTLAGQVVMQGFVHRHIPLWLRRGITMIPSFLVVAMGFDASKCLILSQVVLSFALPVPMITLMIVIRRSDIMGPYRPGWFVYMIAGFGTALILGLNILLVLQSIGVPIPFMVESS